MYDVVVLAGGTLEDEFKPHFDVEAKAFIPIKGRMMVEYVLDVLAEIPDCGKIILVAPGLSVPPPLQEKVHQVARGGRTILESLTAGMSCLPSPAEKVLVLPADIPLITQKSVEDFLKQCESREADLYYSYLSKGDSEQSYPGLHHTYVSLKEGVFCGGSFMLFSPAVLKKCQALFDSITRARKNPLKLAGILGGNIIIKFALRTLAVADLERRISTLLNAKAIGIKTCYAEVGFNVDELSVLKKAQEIISNNSP